MPRYIAFLRAINERIDVLQCGAGENAGAVIDAALSAYPRQIGGPIRGKVGDRMAFETHPEPQEINP